MIKGGQGQTQIDVAVGLGGDAETAWAMAERNGMSLTDEASGLELAEVEMELTGEPCTPATDGEARAEQRKPIGEAEIGKEKIQ